MSKAPSTAERLSRRFDLSPGNIAFWVFMVVAFFGVPALYHHDLLDASQVSLFGKFVALAIVAISLDLVWGYTGVLCLCQSLFFTLGGYGMGMYLAMHGPLDNGNIPRALFVVSSQVSGMTLPWFWYPFSSLPLAILLALMVPGFVALIVGYFGFASRVRGVYFAILTQALTLAAYKVFCLNNMLLCGTNGLTNFVTLAGHDLRDNNVKVGLFQTTVIVFIAVYLLCKYIVSSRMGRVLIAIRDNESRLRFSGYRPHYYKVFVFTLSAMLAGVGGMLYTPQNGIITPSNMAVAPSIAVAIWVAVGGRGTLRGAAFGALIVLWIENFLTTRCPNFWPFVDGGLFIAAALWFPAGMLNVLGGLFLGWIMAMPPVWQEKFWEDDPTALQWTSPSALAYWGYWLVWLAAGVFMIWLARNPDRLYQWLGKLWRSAAGPKSAIPALAPAVSPAAVSLAAEESGLPVSPMVGEGSAVGVVGAHDSTENGSATAGAPPPHEGDTLQQRLSRIALMTRRQPTNLPNGDLLKVEAVKVLFDGFKALDVDAFSLGFYELRVVIGPNGAGKTTLCDVISGKTRATEGSITFAGRGVTNMAEAEIARLGVGRKFQTPTVFDSLSVYQNMELALPGRQGLLSNLFTRETAAEREKIFTILRRVRLAEHADRQVKYLSHGQRQWLEISMLILSGPMLLLVDEPAAGLTDEETVLTAELLLELQEEHSIIVIEHDMDFVRLLGSRVTVLNEGQVMAFGTMDQVQADPKVIEAYLGR
ncbi:MAG TPA: urea ABC transporter permease subunit UrtC [Pirellulales bacterium]|jgi:urea transport system permease protein|nr:urea ABC transporter permease subunit UrtC [Pirellulales bacterium]